MRIASALGGKIVSLLTLMLCTSFPPAVAKGYRIVLHSEYFGIHIHRADRGTRWPFVPFGSWRLWASRVSWAKLEPYRGDWQFRRLDHLMNLADEHHVEPLLTLGVTPQWASARPYEPFVYGAGGAAEPRNLSDWEEYIRTVATRYEGRLHYYEIWNEPAESDFEPVKSAFFTGTVGDLVDLTCSAYRVLKSVDPTIQVVGPGFVGVPERLDRFLAFGGGQCIDIVGYHFYSLTPERMYQEVLHVRDIMSSHGLADDPLWNTEQGFVIDRKRKLGYQVADEETYAAYIPRAFVLAAWGGVDRFFFYSWEHVLTRGGSPTPMTRALAATVRWLLNTKVLSCDKRSDGVWSCALERNGQHAWLVWSVLGSRMWVPPDSWQAVGAETIGGRRTVLEGQSVSLGKAPVLVLQNMFSWRN